MNNLKKIAFAALVLLSTTASPSKAESETLVLQGTLRDFRDTHPDFERPEGEVSEDGTVFAYGLDPNITRNTLGADGKPIYAGGSYSTTNKANFDPWYRDIDGVNQSMPHYITLQRQENGVFRYENTSFFPLNNQLFGNEGRSKNYHFTFEIATSFTYQGGEVFNFSGDDDVWAFIDGQKVIELGGVHERQDANVSLDEVAGNLGLEIGETYNLNFFFAERHTTLSNFVLETSIEFEQVLFAD